MRSPHNAASDVIAELGMASTCQDSVESDPANPRRWVVTFESRPHTLIHSRLRVEVIHGNPHAFACVLERRNVGYRAMNRIMDRLMDRLATASLPSELPPSGGSPQSSPPQDSREPQGDGMPHSG